MLTVAQDASFARIGNRGWAICDQRLHSYTKSCRKYTSRTAQNVYQCCNRDTESNGKTYTPIIVQASVPTHVPEQKVHFCNSKGLWDAASVIRREKCPRLKMSGLTMIIIHGYTCNTERHFRRPNSMVAGLSLCLFRFTYPLNTRYE